MILGLPWTSWLLLALAVGIGFGISLTFYMAHRGEDLRGPGDGAGSGRPKGPGHGEPSGGSNEPGTAPILDPPPDKG